MTFHDGSLLRVANACHPDMDDMERRRILLAVAREVGAPPDVHQSLQASSSGGVGPSVAMRFLWYLEEPMPEPQRQPRAPTGRAGFLPLALGGVLCLTGCLPMSHCGSPPGSSGKTAVRSLMPIGASAMTAAVSPVCGLQRSACGHTTQCGSTVHQARDAATSTRQTDGLPSSSADALIHGAAGSRKNECAGSGVSYVRGMLPVTLRVCIRMAASAEAR